MKRYPSCILATQCVPWDDRGEFGEAIFRRGIRATLAAGTRHIYIFGTAGEGYAVSDRQFRQVATAFVDEMRQGGAEPMVGLISLSLATIRERIDFCRDQGVQHFQLAFPSWGELNARERETFFASTCGQYPDCRFLHYNLPRARCLLKPDEYGRLAERYENLVATKNTGLAADEIDALLQAAPALQHFLSERGYAHAAPRAECGLLASLTLNWERLRQFWEAGQQGDWQTLDQLADECGQVLATLFEVVPRGRIDGAYDKLFARCQDSEFPLRLLPPYESPSTEEFARFVDLLQARLPAWAPRPS